ncbi:hypothetical protein [Hymenobacter sp.]|uniref:TlpA family protein disulfide reductase n=1 Tax=Hymenobacter sp. TaxID=1898978 RepID=UPI002ED7DEED
MEKANKSFSTFLRFNPCKLIQNPMTQKICALLLGFSLYGCVINPSFSELSEIERKTLTPLTTSDEQLLAVAKQSQGNESIKSAADIKIYKGSSDLIRQLIDGSPNQLTHLYIYGSFCKPCVAELPTILQMHQEKKDVNLVMVSPENWSELQKIKAFIYRNKVFISTYVLDLDRYGDEFSVQKRYRKFVDEIYPGHPEILGFPTHIVVDKQYKVQFAGVGAGKLTATVLDSVMQSTR